MSIFPFDGDPVLLFDGAMGTMLQNAGLPTGVLPETYNITHPGVVEQIHRAYVTAGSDIITTNTFQAGEIKLAECIYSVEEVITAAVSCAKASGSRYVALDIGPTGQMMQPMGTLSFERAYEIFARQMIAGESAGADFILIETISDLYEAKAALLAAKENTRLPVAVTMTYQQDGRTFVGCDAAGATLTLCALGADVVGVNCSLGPKELVSVVDEILRYANVPVLVQANAGLPQMMDGETVFPTTPDEYAAFAAGFAKKGVAILGGCCGTTPEFIRQIKESVRDISYFPPTPEPVSAAVSGTRTVFLDNRFTVIGERINPTGKKRLQQAIREQDMCYILNEAINQMEAGADILDVNMGLPDIDEPEAMRRAVREIQGISDLPLQIDSSDPAAIEAGARLCNGRPIINSVNGKKDVLEAILPIAKKYGALVVGLTLDHDGVPETAGGRLAIARRIVEAAAAYGIPARDILIDCLTLTVSAQQDQAKETLRAITLCKDELGVKTSLGVSNVSFGLPARELMNATFLAAAFGAGLDCAIINPMSSRYREVVDACRVLCCQDNDSMRYIERYTDDKPLPSVLTQTELTLTDIILQGRREQAGPKVKKMLDDGNSALEIIDRHFIPALNEVGARFESGKFFLPQLMQSADAVKNGFDVIRANASTEVSGTSKGKILIATVEGDVHDIGKNIVRMMLENYGYNVVDLGRDVPAELVASTIKERGIRLVGLSALMTTTVQNMKKTIALCRAEGLDCRFLVGGAVLTESYAEFVGADWYAKDAMQSVEIANRFFST